MPIPLKASGGTVWDLPPLILHPFNDRVPPSTLLENSKAALMLAGLIPNDGTDRETLTRSLLSGRYAELRMLFFLGKDIFRWIEQCQEWTSNIAALAPLEIPRQSFAAFLTGDPPVNVKEKLTVWGVSDYASVFSRAVGLNAAFAWPPAVESLSEEFLRCYHRYADGMFRTYIELQPYPALAPADFHFELYASGEYSRMLETEWGEP